MFNSWQKSVIHRLYNSMAVICDSQNVTDWICNEPVVEKETEIDSLNSAIQSNFSGYVWKFVELYLFMF